MITQLHPVSLTWQKLCKKQCYLSHYNLTESSVRMASQILQLQAHCVIGQWFSVKEGLILVKDRSQSTAEPWHECPDQSKI